MPKDSHLLPAYSQALLRAARRGQVYRPPAPPVEEEKENAEDEDADGDIEPGFVATKWGVVPRHLEGPEPEFLAKRRKGLGSLYGAVSGAVGASSQMRKTKIKKTDSEGHEYILEAMVPEGQTIAGEVAAEEATVSGAPVPGTVVEGVGVVNAEGVVIAENQVQPTPPRRKPPPPKRKAKGPGRGRKRRVAFAPGAGGVAPSRDFDGSSSSAIIGEGAGQTSHGGIRVLGDGDVEMGDDSVLQDGEEGSEDDEEGDDGEDGDREDGELSPSPIPVPAPPPKTLEETEPIPEQVPTESDPPASETYPSRDLSSSPDLPLASNQTIPPPTIQIETADHVEISESMPVPELHEAPSMNPPLIEEPSQLPQPVTTEAFPPIIDAVSIEDPPQMTDPAVYAALPIEHNPLDGLSEPKATSTDHRGDDGLLFPEGQDDLLGTLERHLDKRS